MIIEYESLAIKEIADFLIITATDRETNQLKNKLEPICIDGSLLTIKKEDREYTAARMNGYNVLHCQCKNMGTQEIGSSTLTTSNALQDWPCIKAVVMLGIAFGMYNDLEDKEVQTYGDVLVAKKIFPYENQRVNKDYTEKYRGKEHESNRHLVDALTLVKEEWNETNPYGNPTHVEICSMLTGEKLIDNLEFRNKLKESHPNTRGGEMEGMGVATVCENAKIPWILIKSICDFADGNKGTTPEEEIEKNQKQDYAALTAVLAFYKALEKVNISNLIGKRVNYFYRPPEINLENIFFINYSKECDDFYLIRSLDKDKGKSILTKSHWISGKTGIGKTAFLRRTLYSNNIKPIYVDLSLCDKSNINELFEMILESVCQYFHIEMPIYSTFHKYIQALCEILDSNWNGMPVYIQIEEIPFDEYCDGFKEFVQKIVNMIIYMSGHLKNAKVFYILSSIAMPKEAIDTYRDKISSHMTFYEMKCWSDEECLQLVHMLCKYVGLVWKDYTPEQFIKRMNNSPRLIKNALKECCSMEFSFIDESIVNKLIVG